MSTSAVSTNVGNFQNPGYYHARSLDLKQLSQDLKSGNLSAAKQDFANIQTLAQSGPAGSGNAFAVSLRQQEFNSIGAALTSGDAASAQQALTSLQNTFQHGGAGGSPTPTGPGSTTPPSSDSGVSVIA
jgi:hypothetical protein